MPAEFEQEQRLREMERKDLLRLQGIDDDGGFDGASSRYDVGQSYGRQVEWGGPPTYDCKNDSLNDKIDLSEGVLNPEEEEEEESRVDDNYDDR